MIFKKGRKVEVFKGEVPYGAWRCAEIIAGNRHNYTVRYAHYLGRTNESAVERMPRNAIRPCPPFLDSMKSWMTGDIVEVFDDFSWKIATVLKILSGEYYLVRLLGFSREFQTHKANIRVRQSWQNDKWVVIGKGSGSSGIAKSSRVSSPNVPKKIDNLLVQAGENTVGADLQEFHVVSARTLKRTSPFELSYADACTGNIQKSRAIEKEGECVRVFSRKSSSLLKKVDAVAYPPVGETYMHTSSNNHTNGYYEKERGKPYCVVECSNGRRSEANDSDSDICSVGSCSVFSDSTSELSSRILAGCCKDADTLSSDAESFSGHADEKENLPLPLGEDVAARIHRLELHAYRCTLVALYASGPLSWEQEALLTNLRITLHISNDEHLMELRNLISAQTSLHTSEY